MKARPFRLSLFTPSFTHDEHRIEIFYFWGFGALRWTSVERSDNESSPKQTPFKLEHLEFKNGLV